MQWTVQNVYRLPHMLRYKFQHLQDRRAFRLWELQMKPGMLAPTLQNLIRLRSLVTALALLAVYAFASSYMSRGHFEHFETHYYFVLALLGSAASLAGWLSRWRAFLALAILDRAISTSGALLFIMDLTVPGAWSASSRSPAYVIWDCFNVALSMAVLVHILRKYPMGAEGQTENPTLPFVARCMQAGMALLSIEIAVEEWPSFARHWIEQGVHTHACSWTLARMFLAVVMMGACIAGLFNQRRAFLSLGFMSLGIVAFFNFSKLSWLSAYTSWRDVLFEPPAYSTNVPVFAATVFLVVYVAGRFPPVIRLRKAQ